MLGYSDEVLTSPSNGPELERFAMHPAIFPLIRDRLCKVGPGADLMFTYPCLFSMKNREANIQGGVNYEYDSTAGGDCMPGGRRRRGWLQVLPVRLPPHPARRRPGLALPQ